MNYGIVSYVGAYFHGADLFQFVESQSRSKVDTCALILVNNHYNPYYQYKNDT